MKLPVRYTASCILDADDKVVSMLEIIAALNAAPRPEELPTPNLPFIVEYRRKPELQYRGFGAEWVAMAAFDYEGPAEVYAKQCSAGDRPWEYRVRPSDGPHSP